MRRRNVYGHVFLLLAFGAYVGVPLLHTLATAAGRCTICRTLHDHTALLLERCEGPCRDRTHHHHRSHDSDHCVVCRTLSLCHALMSASDPGGAVPPPRAVPSAYDCPIGRLHARAGSIRAPPVNSV